MPPMPSPATNAVTFDTQILENEQERQRPDADTHDKLDHRQGIAHGRLRAARRQAPLQGRGDDPISPKRDLDKEGDNEERKDEFLCRGRQREKERRCIDRGDDDEERRRLFDQLAEHGAPAQILARARLGQAMKQEQLGDEGRHQHRGA